MSLTPPPPARTWTVEEYTSRFRFDKGLKSLLVEADTDSEFYNWFLRRSGLHVEVLAARHVAQDKQLRERLNLDSGVKSHLLSVGHELTRRNAPRSNCVAVDHDHDGVRGIVTTHVVTTDGYSLESYAFDSEFLDGWIARRFARNRRVSGQELLDRITPALIWLSACRQILRSMSVRLDDSWLAHLDVKHNPAIINERRVLTSCVPATMRDRTDELLNAVKNEAHAGQVNANRFVRGHDFTAALLKLLKTRWAREQGVALNPRLDRDDFEGELRAAFEHGLLNREPFFVSLTERLSG